MKTTVTTGRRGTGRTDFLLRLLLACGVSLVVAAMADEQDATDAVAEKSETKAEAAEKTEAKEAPEEGETKAETETPEPLTPEQMFEGGDTTYNNWMELSLGGFTARGNNAEAKSRAQISEGMFGGIESMHFQKEVAKDTTLSLDGRAIYDNHDYKFDFGLVRPELGFVHFNYEQFRTWYNGDGGYYVPGNVWFPLSGSSLELDRGQISVEAGLTLKDVPQITFRYTHAYRDGEKSSTIWGQTHPDLTSVTRGLSPSFYDIDETRDIFELEAAHRIKPTDVGLVLLYKTGDLDNALKTNKWPNNPAVERKITDRQKTSYDMFSAHGFTETWIKPTLLFTTGYQFVNSDGDISGSRIYGSTFDAAQSPNALNGLGYTNLSGSFCRQDYVMNVNLMAMLTKTLVVIPSLRVQKVDWNADSDGYQTQGTSAATYRASDSDGDSLDVTGRLEARYTGVTNWVFYTRGEWTQGDGRLDENGGMGMGTGSIVDRRTDECRFFQKYTAGARWYPHRKLTVDLSGYYKRNEYDYDNDVDNTPNNSANRYPAYFVGQTFETYDGAARLTLRPFRNVTLVSRYEYQQTKIYTDPDSISGLDDEESGKTTSHIFGQNVSWAPWSRLYLQAGFNYVCSETETPTSDYTDAVSEAENNYWTLNFDAGFVVDDKTDLNAGCFYYKADNGSTDPAYGVIWGANTEEYGITAAITRRVSNNLRLTLRYAYFHSEDDTSGGNNNFESHAVFSSLQYRF